MNKSFFLSFFACLFLLSSCIEIVDDLQINEDGSGTLKYNINLSSSKVKINSYLALDSLDGKKVPSIEEISTKLNTWINELKKEDGIQSATLDSDFTQFIFRLKIDFENLQKLESGIKSVVKKHDEKGKIQGMEHIWISFTGNQLERKTPNAYKQKAHQLKKEEISLLKEGSYTSIVRFPKEIERSSHPKAKISKNRKAVMVRENTYSLMLEHTLLDQVVFLKN